MIAGFVPVLYLFSSLCKRIFIFRFFVVTTWIFVVRNHRKRERERKRKLHLRINKCHPRYTRAIIHAMFTQECSSISLKLAKIFFTYRIKFLGLADKRYRIGCHFGLNIFDQNNVSSNNDIIPISLSGTNEERDFRWRFFRGEINWQAVYLSHALALIDENICARREIRSWNIETSPENLEERCYRANSSKFWPRSAKWKLSILLVS